MSDPVVYHFGNFRLDVADRRLLRDDQPIELAPRYFDALSLLVREQGRLVEKDRFFTEVWSGVPVGDEALTQCIKTLRRALGDDAGKPRFIQTVPKHGYRFLVPAVHGPTPSVMLAATDAAAPAEQPPASFSAYLRAVMAAALGGGVAGIAGGLLYGSLVIGSVDAVVGQTSTLALLIALCAVVGALGGFGIGLGLSIAAALSTLRLLWVVGAALGGLAVGAATKLLGLDAFNLLLGYAPVGITGGVEGAVLGGAVALGLIAGKADRYRPVLRAGLAGAIAGSAIILAGGHLMAGSLELVGSVLAGSVDSGPFAAFVAALDFGGAQEAALGAMEGSVFSIGVAGALALARLPQPLPTLRATKSKAGIKGLAEAGK